VADRLIFMELGTITWAGPASSLDVEQLSAVYLGGGRPASVTAGSGADGINGHASEGSLTTP